MSFVGFFFSFAFLTCSVVLALRFAGFDPDVLRRSVAGSDPLRLSPLAFWHRIVARVSYPVPRPA